MIKSYETIDLIGFLSDNISYTCLKKLMLINTHCLSSKNAGQILGQ